ncbi:MAG: xanthine dehydrogenase accessory protein XdhC [Candidatus Schekmanbacteria bacterium]|nr:MAG: xanthine dehydrogenase accessory protein XdhC [Candidatus Schekmanbacteria bacterium]
MDIYDEIQQLKKEGKAAALITVIETKGSTPREEGAKMIVVEDGTIRGTIGGGCVEGQVYEEAKEIIRKGGLKILEFDLLDDELDGEGQMCGGKMKVLIESLAPQKNVIIFGAGHISLYLSKICKMLDFNVTVTDDREEYASRERFPEADNVIVSEFEKVFEKISVNHNTYIVIVTRGHKYDKMMLEESLKTDAFYIGMIGSRSKLKGIFDSLKAKGFSEEDIKRVHSPIGIPIHSESPQEIAISIAAELIKESKENAHS